MKKQILFFLLIASPLWVFSQVEKIVDSEIKNVIVYQQGSLITREAKCSFQKGKTTLIFKGLSSKIDQDNLQVKPENDNLTILSVSHSIDYLNKTSSAKELDKLESKKRDIADSLKILKSIKAVYEQEKDMIVSNKSIGGTNGVNIADLQGAAAFFRTRLSEIETNTYQIERKSYHLKERLVEISKQLLELNSQTDLPSSQVKVIVSSEKVIESTVKLEYLIAEASWTADYDIRIKDVDSPLNLTYKAKVTQNSGEDWKDVRLTLSTGNPSVSNSKPDLESYYLTFNNFYSNFKPSSAGSSKKFTGKIEGTVTDADDGEALPGCNVVVKGTTTGTVSDINGKFSIEVPSSGSTLVFSYIGYEHLELPANTSFSNVKLKPAVMALQEVVVTGYGVSKGDAEDREEAATRAKKREMIPLAIQKQQTSTDFKINIPYSIPSDNKEYDVSMVQYEVPALYSYSAVPKLSKDVYLVARFTDWTRYNMLDGNASLFFKGIYQGETYLNLKSLEDTLSLSVGRDKEIIIEREAQKDFTSKGIMNSYKKELKGWNINVKNNKDIAVKLVVEDQYPVSKSDEIKVELLELSGAVQEKETGKLTWNIELKPKEKKTLLLQYSVKYPRERKVLVE